MSASLENAWAHWQGGRLEEAMAACREVLSQNPDAVPALHLLGQIQARQGDPLSAAQTLQRASRLAPDRADLHKQAGELFGATGDVGTAERHFVEALRINPRMYAVRYNLALVLMADGRLEQAAELLHHVVTEHAGLAPAWLQYGGVLNAIGRYEDADKALRRHLELAENSVAGWTWLGATQQFRGRFDEAEACYRQALAIDPGAADAHANLGKLLQAQGQPEQAESCFRAALDLSGDHPQALSGMAAWLDNKGRYDEALDLLTSAEQTPSSETAAIRARLLAKLGRQEEARSLLEEILADPSLPREAQSQLRFSLARVLDQLGSFPEAWRYAAEANQLRREDFGGDAVRTDLARLETAVTDLETYFADNVMPSLARSEQSSELPVFILGMPRAGKSLVEQILCSHPSVHGAGELTGIPDLAADFGKACGGWPDGVGGLTRAMLDEGGDRYLAGLAAIDRHALRVTDTMPFNYLHVGLIELLFPRARVLHCRRHPLDLALRCYFKNFAGRGLAFTFDLDSLAHYLGHYQRVMDHWARVSSLAIYEVRYESLVADTETETRRLIDFVGLPWQDDCLRYFEDGVATSASDTPIRQPLDNREVGGWSNYGTHLEPFSDALAVEAYAAG